MPRLKYPLHGNLTKVGHYQVTGLSLLETDMYIVRMIEDTFFLIFVLLLVLVLQEVGFICG